MKSIRHIISIVFLLLCISGWAQDPREGNTRFFEPVIDGEVVYRGKDVVFRKIGEGTWMGSGHLIASETLYLLEGKNKALLIDTGTRISGLQKIISNITDKPVTVVLTHIHGDHAGNIDSFPEIWINPNELPAGGNSADLTKYPGKVRHLSDGQKIDLGGRTIEVLFAPGHTLGSTIFLDPSRKCGYSGSAFGSGNLNLKTSVSSFISMCKSTLSVLKKKKINILYPGHYFGNNPDTPERIKIMQELASDILSGKVEGAPATEGYPGNDKIASRGMFKIGYSSSNVK